MEDERDGFVRPLNEQVAAINDCYRTPRESLKKICELLVGRLSDYVKREKEKREAEAEEKRRAAELAEQRAREAEAREQEAKAEAAAGVIDVDIGSATAVADQAFSKYEKAEREAARAEKDTNVKIGGGFKRALALRVKETLEVTDWQAAITEMGLTPAIKDAILTSARAFRKATGDLPDGIQSTKEETL